MTGRNVNGKDFNVGDLVVENATDSRGIVRGWTRDTEHSSGQVVVELIPYHGTLGDETNRYLVGEHAEFTRVHARLKQK
jgi:hypothetical protein